MAIQVQGNGGVVADVDGTTFRALRVTARPINYGTLGMYRIGASSGTMAVSLAALAEIFQWRWPDATNLGLVYRVDISACANVAASTAQLQHFLMTICRAWTAAGSGGSRLTMTGNNAKLRTSMGTSLINDIGISTTAGMTGGTKTIDTTHCGAVSFGIGTGAITVDVALNLLPQSVLLDADGEGQHPIVCAQNEGFIIRNANSFPAGMTWAFSVNCVWAEAAAF